GPNEGIIQNPSGMDGFKTLALYSADGKLVLTAGGPDGRLQLWSAPAAGSRAMELRHLVSSDRSPVNCAAFAPDGSFVAAGNKDRQVHIWGPLPSEKDIAEFQIPGVISNIDHALDASANQVRIFAEFDNPKNPKDESGLLMPGGTVTLVIPANT